jgi:hypothetical protein
MLQKCNFPPTFPYEVALEDIVILENEEIDDESEHFLKIVKLIVENVQWKESVPMLARYHVVKWRTSTHLPNNNYDNVMTFKLMYLGKFAKNNGKWHECVGPHRTLLGKDEDRFFFYNRLYQLFGQAQSIIPISFQGIVDIIDYNRYINRYYRFS